MLLGVLFAGLHMSVVHSAIVCTGQVKSVAFSGNKVTKDNTIAQRIEIKPGTDCTSRKIEEARQEIMNMGLFKSVEARFDQSVGKIEFIVVERHYILPLPRVSRNADGEVQLGGQLRFDNFRGLNHKLKLAARREVEDDGQGNSGNVVSARYEIPRFRNSDYGLLLGAGGTHRTEESFENAVEIGRVKRRQHSVTVRVSRFLQSGRSLRGWRLNTGGIYTDRQYQLLSGELGPLQSGVNAELRFAAANNQVQLDEYRRRGFEYGAELGVAARGIIGDFSYIRLTAFYRLYLPLKSEVYENLNVQLRLGAASRGAFGESSFRVGGSSTLRGFASDSLQGEKMAVVNIEYLRSLRRRPGLRLAAIMDVAAVKNGEPFQLSDVRAGVGGGFRWKIRSFVNTDLKLDVAWGLGGGGESRRFYLGTNVVF